MILLYILNLTGNGKMLKNVKSFNRHKVLPLASKGENVADNGM